MFCEKCGAKLPDGASFCEKCGTPANGAAAAPGATASAGASNGAYYAPAAAAKPSALKRFFSVKRNVVITAVCAAVLLLLIIILAVVGAQPKKVYVDDCFDLVYTGCDGYGQVDIKWDDEAVAKIDKKIFSKKTNKDDFGINDLFGSIAGQLYSLKNCVAVDLVYENDYLKNGDKITVSVKANMPSFEERYGIKLAVRHKTVKVKGLAEAVGFDPFAAVTVGFEGYSGYGKLRLTLPETPVSIPDTELVAVFGYTDSGFSVTFKNGSDGSAARGSFYCVADKLFKLSSGEEICFTVRNYDTVAPSLAANCGITLSVTEKKVKVENIGEIMTFDPATVATVTFSGFSGYAVAAVDIAGDKTIGSYVIKAEANVSSSRLRIEFDVCDVNGNRLRSFQYSADKVSNFANSDVVTFTLNNNSDSLEADYGITLADSFSVTVSGLEEPVDPALADHMKVTFEGFEGYGSLGEPVIETDVYTVGKYTFKLTPGMSSYRRNLTVVVADETGNLFTIEYRVNTGMALGENGSTVEFACRSGNGERTRIAREYGIAFPESLVYTVSGLKQTTKVDPREQLTYAFSGENGSIQLDFGLKQAEITAGGYTVQLTVESGINWGRHRTTLSFSVAAEDGMVYTGSYYVDSGSLNEGDTITIRSNVKASEIASAIGLVFETDGINVIVSTK